MSAKPRTGKQVHQFKITLKGSKPPIWRRILVSPEMTLAGLHRVIQVVMPWWNCHLHEFRIRGNYYGIPNEEDGEDTTIAENLVSVGKIARSAGTRFTYVYDFGDDWQHDILLEEILPAGSAASLPICVAGKLRCPPENSGSLWGYYDKLEILKHPEHTEYANTKEWLGRDWDPERFDIEGINQVLMEDFRTGSNGPAIPP